jgi:PAS domain S-box-containing protein
MTESPAITHPITRALLAAIPHSVHPMVVTDPSLPDHPMIAVNPAFEALTGYTAAETVGRNCRFLQGEGTHPDTPKRIRRSLSEGRGCIEWIVNYRRDGSRFWNLLFLSPVFDRDGTLLHYFGNQRDITKGPPAGVVEYTVGKADMPLAGQEEFHALLLDVLDQGHGAAADDESRARELERIVETVRKLNDVTTTFATAEWSPPPVA